MKRRIALAKGQNQIKTVMELLNEYLEIFQTDVEAWDELADLYFAEGLLEQAAYCREECIVLRPTNWTFMCQYAEVRPAHPTKEHWLKVRHQDPFANWHSRQHSFSKKIFLSRLGHELIF
jgi:tetratricopeptide (TPR) repeat protein